MIHENTRASYEQCKEDDKYDKLIWIIARFYEVNKEKSFTDREIKDILYSEGKLPFNDMNMVRPKITKLIDDGFVVEIGDVIDLATDRMVRKVKWNVNPEFPVSLFNGV